MRIDDLRIDEEFKNLLPELTADEYTGLEKSILRDGVMCPIVTWKGFIVDGHNRYSICKAHRFQEVETREIRLSSRSEVVDWIINNQLSRRNLTKSELVHAYQVYEAELAREAASKPGGRPKKTEEKPSSNLNAVSDKVRTAAEVAKKIGVSENTYRDMKLIVKEGTPEQVERMDRGGKGNAVSAIAAEIKETREVTEKKCRKCGKILPISDFPPKKNTCRICMAENAADWRKRTFRDVKGDIIRSTGEFASVSDEEIIGNLYDTEAEVITTTEDVAEEITVNAKKAITMLKRIFETNQETIKGNEQIFSEVWSEIETLFASIRKEYI